MIFCSNCQNDAKRKEKKKSEKSSWPGVEPGTLVQSTNGLPTVLPAWILVHCAGSTPS